MLSVAETDPEVFPEAVTELLRAGQSVRFSAAGNSMHPTIQRGDLLIIEPCHPRDLAVGDIILYKDGRRLFAHRIIRIQSPRSGACGATRFVLRGDFRFHPDPPVTASQILGKIISVERKKQALSPYGCGKRLLAGAYRMASYLKSYLPT